MGVWVYGYMSVSSMELRVYLQKVLLFYSDNFLEISFHQLQKGIDFNSLLCEGYIHTGLCIPIIYNHILMYTYLLCIHIRCVYIYRCVDIFGIHVHVCISVCILTDIWCLVFTFACLSLL